MTDSWLRGATFAVAAGGAAFDPEDGVGVGGFQEELEVVANVGGALAEACSFVYFAEAFELASRRCRALRAPR